MRIRLVGIAVLFVLAGLVCRPFPRPLPWNKAGRNRRGYGRRNDVTAADVVAAARASRGIVYDFLQGGSGSRFSNFGFVFSVELDLESLTSPKNRDSI